MVTDQKLASSLKTITSPLHPSHSDIEIGLEYRGLMSHYNIQCCTCKLIIYTSYYNPFYNTNNKIQLRF